MGDPGSGQYGRNFDWEFSPALLLFTDPDDGYASVSMVDIAYLGFEKDTAKVVARLPLSELHSLFLAPWLPIDGMNEAGLVVGMAAVPPGNVQPDPARPTIPSLVVIREMLDHAGSVEEAVAIMQAYNIDFTGGPPMHYLVADRSGSAALVEFYVGKVHVFPSDKPWHQATNFMLAEAGEAATGRCSRYDVIRQELARTQGKMTSAEAMTLLSTVAQPHTQWSVVYGMGSLQVEVAMGQRYEAAHTFDISAGGAGP
jgi:choloylglycine hydrolase